MKRTVLEFLVCPDCGVALTCHAVLEKDDDIESGALDCAQCGLSYPIVRGIPRFVTLERPLSGQNVETADAFGWEWQEFTELHDLPTYEAQFLDWVTPIQPGYLQGKVVLDAGCGMGRFSLVAQHFGARAVLAVDASAAVEAAHQNTHWCHNIHVIQADIHHLPLRRAAAAQMEFVFSIGVLHHLDDPQAGFRALVNHLHKKGSLFAWVYGRENNGWLINVINPVRITLTSRLPRRALYALSWLLTLGLHPIVRYVYRPASIISALRPLCRILPYRDYLAWLGQFGLRHNHHVVFDHLVAPVAFYLRREEFAGWFDDSGLEIVEISWRNRNSWRGHGRFAG
jgi:2-polyprenyl-3-methyl-5-hydroxy-6-metoxy-1,4-benzoquinol methylase/uncharacterized protein YbaR (Trm112 family)